MNSFERPHAVDVMDATLYSVAIACRDEACRDEDMASRWTKPTCSEYASPLCTRFSVRQTPPSIAHSRLPAQIVPPSTAHSTRTLSSHAMHDSPTAYMGSAALDSRRREGCCWQLRAIAAALGQHCNWN
ncbi:hypothetical protein J1614_004526 [Plenodomus biglobosus]|nr:hypothetical protein J1614_004526 [Plenodomus biglobosus]